MIHNYISIYPPHEKKRKKARFKTTAGSYKSYNLSPKTKKPKTFMMYTSRIVNRLTRSRASRQRLRRIQIASSRLIEASPRLWIFQLRGVAVGIFGKRTVNRYILSLYTVIQAACRRLRYSSLRHPYTSSAYVHIYSSAFLSFMLNYIHIYSVALCCTRSEFLTLFYSLKIWDIHRVRIIWYCIQW